MAAISYYLGAAILDHVFSNAAYSKPTSIKVKLYSVAPSASGGGTEIVGTGYSSGGITTAVGTSDWPLTVANSNQKVFAGGTNPLSWSVGSTWPSVVAWGITDQSGNLLFFGDLDTPVSPVNGDTVSFAANSDLKITVS